MNYRLPINTIKEQIEAKLQHNFGLTLENATDDQCYKAVVLVVRDLMVKGYLEFKKRAEETHTKLLPLHGIPDGTLPEEQPVQPWD